MKSNAIIDIIGDRPCVSFDIYDTLVIRPYVLPTDLFRHAERISGKEGFANTRITAEKDARRRHGREITLDEIYAEIDEKYREMIDLEERMEIDLPLPNPEMKELLERLSEMGKRIVLISDMYLPVDVIGPMLKRCGIDRYERLYVSSESFHTKHDGSLYAQVMEDLDIEPKDLFHIGDNRHSDFNVPDRKGIASYRIKRPIEEYFSTHRDEYRFYKKERSLERSIMVSIDMINGLSDNVWHDIGKRFGGPLATSFSMTVNDGDGLYLYASRDGYNIKRISEELYPERKTGYVFTQRLILDVLSEKDLPYVKIELPSKLSERYRYEKTTAAIRRTLGFFRSDLNITIPKDNREMCDLYNSLVNDIGALRRERLNQYKDYLNSMCQSSDIHLIDCTTMKFSSQRLMESITGKKVKGHYLVTLSDSDLQYDTMCDWQMPVIGWMNVDIPEFFLCSPEYPLSGWDNGPVFDDEDINDRFRVSIYGDVSDGELDYAKCYKTIFKEYMIPFDYWSVVRWSKLSIASGSVYRDEMKKIMWASNPDHSDYVPLVTGSLSIRQILRKIFIGAISKINKE